VIYFLTINYYSTIITKLTQSIQFSGDIPYKKRLLLIIAWMVLFIFSKNEAVFIKEAGTNLGFGTPVT